MLFRAEQGSHDSPQLTIVRVACAASWYGGPAKQLGDDMIDLSLLLSLLVWLLGRYLPLRPQRHRPSLRKPLNVVQLKAFSLLVLYAELML